MLYRIVLGECDRTVSLLGSYILRKEISYKYDCVRRHAMNRSHLLLSFTLLNAGLPVESQLFGAVYIFPLMI